MLVLFLLIFFIYVLNVAVVLKQEGGNKTTTLVHTGENGFEPNIATIRPNTEVVFENVGEEEHWPSTDNHPTHSLYDGTSLEEHCGYEASPTFDSCGPISAGETWSFIFKKAGTFTYHDHLWPHLKGEIIVEEEDKINFFSRFLDFFRQIFVSFMGREKKSALNSEITEKEQYQNLVTRYEDLVLERNPREAIQALEEESLLDSTVFAVCHDILHQIGHTAYKKYGSFQGAVQFQSDFCNSGYIHGIFESFFESGGDSSKGLAEQCGQYASIGGRPFDLWQCHHGVGHGFMYLTGGDLDKSLALCESGLGTEGKSSCQNGVFMEVFNLEVLAKENDYINPGNPFLTCSSRDIAKGDCYVYIPTYLSQTKAMEFKDILIECDRAEPGYKSSCIGGVGSEAMKRNMNDPELVFALCKQMASSTDQNSCVRGVVGMYMNQTGSYSSGQTLCEIAPQEFRTTCKNSVTSKKAFFKQN